MLIDGLDGGSTAAGHEGWFEISGYDLDLTRLASLAGSGTVAGRVTFDPLDVTLPLGDGLTALLTKLAAGQLIRSIKIDGVTDGPRPQTVFQLKLGDVALTHVGEGHGEDDQLSFFYGQISVTTWPQLATGALGTPSTFSYDVLRDRPEVSISDAQVGSVTGTVLVPATYYLLVDGVNGGSTDSGHEGWFEISGYDLDIGRLIDLAHPGLQRPQFDPLDVTLQHGQGLTALLNKVATGQLIESIKIEGVTGGSNPQRVFQLKLGNVALTHVGDGSGAADQLSFVYGQINVTTWPTLPTGALGAPATFSYDVLRGQVGVTVPDPQVAPGSGAVPTPVTYYLLIDGVNGGATARGHEGWFEISGYDLDIEHLVSLIAGGGGAAEKPEFDPLGVTLALGSGLTDLLAKVATGQLIRSIKIDGVTAGERPQTVFSLKLGDVTVSQLSDAAGPNDQLSFSYGQISVTTWPQQPNGAVGAPTTFSYDVARNQPNASIPEPRAAPTSGAVSAAPHIFLRIDDVDGGSTEARHEGWFEIDGYELDIAGILTAPVGPTLIHWSSPCRSAQG
ncbi:type VI secretion system tube protein Hcp [Chelatococcus reniformis]|uniref:Uncharacterized protein n=1 Tax=Chelatococcus reniformis TaxID=1494448 RepID=A0A916U5M3_9HYPH|nr:type VI secretion system tube protein Hcp [Chelatococcus reniformis]GGC60296.1 hypothetical protein GCM10010994_18680 [Chelatococcus reniformis]